MDEVKNTPENNPPQAPEQSKVSLEELLKWADQAIDSLEKPKKPKPQAELPSEAEPAPKAEAVPTEQPDEEPAPHQESCDAPDPVDHDHADDYEDDIDDIDYNDDELLRGSVILFQL